MILGGGGRFGGALRFTPKMPKLPKLARRGGKGPGMSDGGEGGGGEGGGAAAAPEPSDGGDDSSNPLVNVEGVERLLDEKPLLMKMATSATGFFIGDVLAQKFIQKNDPFDYARLFRLASFGFLVHGTTSHWFYGMLDGKIPGTSAGVVASKVFIDQVLWNPIFGIMFFSYVAVLELKGLGYVVDKIQNELMTQVTVVVEGGVAGGARDQLPLHSDGQRVLYINSIQIGYNCFLSLISNRQAEEA